MKNTPLVSVVIPTHDRPDLLRRALESVFAQTLSEFEIIVVDDGDEAVGAGEVVRSFGDERVRYVRQTKPHSGAPAARNRGAREARTEFIAFLDDDDEWLPEKLSLQAVALSDNPDAAAAFTGIALYDERGNLIGERWPEESGVVRVFERTLLHPYIWTSALMVRASVFHAVGGFDEAFPKNQEWDLTLRLSKEHSFIAINKLLTNVHVQGDGAHLGGRANLHNIIKGHEMLLAKHKTDYALHPKALGRIAFILFGLYRQAGDVKGMWRALGMARNAEPRNYVYLRHTLALCFGSRFYFKLFNTFSHD